MNANNFKHRMSKLLIVLVASLYIGVYVTAVLTETIDVNCFWIGVVALEEIFGNTQKLKMLLGVLCVEVLGYLYVTTHAPDYKSRLINITPDICIPAPAGQGQFGSARFYTKDEINSKFKSQLIPKSIIKGDVTKFKIPSGGFVIGKVDTPKGEKVYYIDEDKHTLTLGGTGSGKTRCHVLNTIAFLALAGESFLAIDVKGEISDYTKVLLKILGYEVKIIDYIHPEYSDYWNYLQVIIDNVDAGNIPAAIDATWDLTAQLVGEAKGEKIWNDGEASMIAAAIMAVVYDNREGANKKYQNLANVYYFLINMCKAVTVGQKSILPLSIYVNSLPDSHPSKGLLGVSDIAPSRTRGSFYTAAVMTLKLFTNPYIANMSSKSNFNFADLSKKKMAVFILLPDDRKTYHSLATLMITQANTILSREADAHGGRLLKRVHFIEDEFGNFTKIADVDVMFAMSRSKGIIHNIFIQSYAQLEKIYEKVGEKIIKDNCSITIYLKANSEETLKEVSDSLHDYTIQSYSLNTNSNSTATSITSTGSSVSLQGRKLLMPDDLLKLNRPYSLIIGETHPAIMYAPDISQWSFNELLGMGDKEHNIKLRMERQSMRVKHDVSPEIELWGIWNVIVAQIKQKQRERELAAEAERRHQEMLLQMLQEQNNGMH